MAPHPDTPAALSGPDLSPLGRLVEEVLQRGEVEGPAALEAVCAAHPAEAEALRRRVGFLADQGLAPDGPRTCGPYRILRTLGGGGMGVVYLAWDARLCREVALKALPARLAGSARLQRRFEREVRAVARLRHPAIVPIHDVGTDEGVPWFTMDYVEGRSLADLLGGWSGRRASDLVGADLGRPGEPYAAAVSRLVVELADALQHAHDHGVVHRDVKPGNVLVAADSRPLLVDFGLARTLADEPMTLTGDLAGTPHYMAPEQIDARAGGADHRVDVYGLGGLLYELLTLRRPFEAQGTEELFARVLRDPPAAFERDSPASRDLQTVVFTALEKEPARRYPSAAELAADLRRVLDGRPILAKPAGRGERLVRWVRRKPAAAAAAGLFGLLLLGGPVMLLAWNRTIAAEKERAQEQAADAEEARAFLASILEAASPDSYGHDVTVREVLDDADARAGRLDDPDLERSVRRTLGQTYIGLGDFPAAIRQLERILVLLRAAPEGREVQLAEAQNDLGVALARSYDLEAAEPLLLESLALRERLFPPPSEPVASSLLNLSNLCRLAGRSDEAESYARLCIDMRWQLFGEEHASMAEALQILDSVLAQRPEHGADTGLSERALAIARRHLGADDLLIAGILAELGLREHRLGRLALAEEHLRESQAISRQRQGDDHPRTALVMMQLGRVKASQGDDCEAEDLLRAAISVFERVYDRPMPADADARESLARVLAHQGRLEEAELQQRRALELRRSVFGDAGPMTFIALLDEAQWLGELERWEERGTLLDEFERTYRETKGETHWMRGQCLELLAETWQRAGLPERARPYEAELEQDFGSVPEHVSAAPSP